MEVIYLQLRDLDATRIDPKVILLQTPSTQLGIYVWDKLRLRYHSNSDSIIDITAKKDLKRVKEICATSPPFGEKWLVRVPLGVVEQKEFVKLVQESISCVFFCISDKYKQFKGYKTAFKDENIIDLYIMYMRRADMLYLYDALVPEVNRLSKPLFDYVAQSYSSDIDAIFDLFLALNRGEEFTSRKDIADLCGLGNNSVESFVFTLLKPPSSTDKGIQSSMRNRVKIGVDLGNTLGWGTFYNFLNSSLESFIQIKMLMISGVVYKQIDTLPDVYDTNKLAKYNKYIWRLGGIPLSRFLRIKSMLSLTGRWGSGSDFLEFIYGYYSESVKMEVLNVNCKN